MPDLQAIQPRLVLREVVNAIPMNVRQHVVIIGSLAAAYWFSKDNTSFIVRTKDVDSVLSPRSAARESAQALASKLVASGWSQKSEGKFSDPGSAKTPDDELPALRLHPPQHRDWFIELLTEPEVGQQTRRWLRFVLSTGEHFGLPSFQFTSVATHDAVDAIHGVRVARVEMMALANLLEHPNIRPDIIDGTTTKRSNKDLGRVLAIARLSSETAIESWARSWGRALQDRFPEPWRALARRAGTGLRELLASPSDLQQAVENCNNGLLAGQHGSAEQLMATGNRLLATAIEELAAMADD